MLKKKFNLGIGEFLTKAIIAVVLSCVGMGLTRAQVALAENKGPIGAPSSTSYVPLVAVGNHIWADNGEADGIYQSTDTNMAGVVVQAFDGNSSFVATTTDENGQYLFQLPADSVYVISYVIPAGYQASGLSNQKDISDATNNQNHINGITITVGVSANLNLDFAVTGLIDAPPPVGVYLGDHVWRDNGVADGIYQITDTNLEGITITATSNLGVAHTTFSDANGHYELLVPPNATYTVTYEIPPGLMASATPGAGGEYAVPNGSVVVVTTTSIVKMDFALAALPPPVSAVNIGDHIWRDNGVVDGVYQPTDTNLAGVIVSATNGFGQTFSAITDDNGRYTLTVPGNATYTVTYELPNQSLARVSRKAVLNANRVSGETGNELSHQTLSAVVVVTNSDVLNVDFSTADAPVALGSHVWKDAGVADGVYQSADAGVSGVVVTATNSAGLSFFAVTDANGLYTLTVPANDTYTVTHAIPATLAEGDAPSGKNTSNATNDTGHTNGLAVVITQTANLNLDFALKNSPTAIELAYFEARPTCEGVDLAWQTLKEEDTAGFLIYRGADGVFANAAPVTENMVMAFGNGGVYGFADGTAKAGRAYTYFLVEVLLNGSQKVNASAAVMAQGCAK